MLAVAVAAQIAARVLDAGIETPAEKVALTLLPAAVRGRVGGFLDGPAKRAGAVLGGVLAAALAGAPPRSTPASPHSVALWALAAGSRLARAAGARDRARRRRGRRAHGRRRARARRCRRRSRDQRTGTRLASERSERAAELLARLHAHGRVDAVGSLVDAAASADSPAMWRALIAVLSLPAPAHGPTVLAAAHNAGSRVRLLAIRTLGLVGGISPDALAEWRVSELDDDAPRGSVAITEGLVARVAALRLAGDRAELREVLLDATRDAPIASIALDELVVELARALAAEHADDAKPTVRSPDEVVRSPDEAVRSPDEAVRSPDEAVLVAARAVVRSLVRGAGDIAARAAAFATLGRAVRSLRGVSNGELALVRASLLELVRERVDASASAPAPEHALVSLMRVPAAAGPAGMATATATIGDPAIEIAAALRALGVLLETAVAIDDDDLRRLSRALGEPDDDVRAAAEDAFASLGSAGVGELIATVAWGRRRARDRAAICLPICQ